MEEKLIYNLLQVIKQGGIMATKGSEESIRKLLSEKEDLPKKQPGFSQSYSQFLRDWEEYSKSQQVSKKAEDSCDYLVFGASFQE